MQPFDKRMAFDVIEDALNDVGTPQGRGVVAGLCGAFHMCGLLNAEEWAAFMQRIPQESRKVGAGRIRAQKVSGARVRGRYLN